MSDVLALLAELDKAEKKGKPNDIKANTKRNASAGTHRTLTGRQSRPISLPPPPRKQSARPPLSPDRPESSYSERSASSSYTPSLRRISFAEAPVPAPRRMRIPTRTDALSSGFPYDPRLFKYGVTSAEWNDFSNEVIEAAQVPLHSNVPALSWTWKFQKSKVTKAVKQQMQYENSDLQRVMKRWNRLFKKQGFHANLQLPHSEDEKERGGRREEAGDTKEEREQAKSDARRFRIVISPTAEKQTASIYSRTSSLTRTVTGEGMAATRGKIQPIGVEPDHDQEPDEDDSHERDDTASPSPQLQPTPKRDQIYEQNNSSNSLAFSQSESQLSVTSGDNDSIIPPLQLDAKPEINDDHDVTRTALPEVTDPVVHERVVPNFKTDSKESVVEERPAPRSHSTSHSKKPKPPAPAKSLDQLLTTAGGFDEWNDMDDDYV